MVVFSFVGYNNIFRVIRSLFNMFSDRTAFKCAPVVASVKMKLNKESVKERSI